MDAEHHDLVLAITSHLPHLIAYNIVGTAADLESVTRGEVIKFSAGGFRDFTRIAASDPTMWRDVFLNNRKRCWRCSTRFNDDLAALHAAQSAAATATTLFDCSRAPAPSAARSSRSARRRRQPDFGRPHGKHEPHVPMPRPYASDD